MVGRSVREEDVAAANECNARFYPLFAPLSVREVGADTQLSDLSFAPPCIVSSFIILNPLSKSLASVLWPRLADEASHPDDVTVVQDGVHTEVVMVSSVALKF